MSKLVNISFLTEARYTTNLRLQGVLRTDIFTFHVAVEVIARVL